MKLRKGDEVVVLSGKDVGKRGTITQVLPEREKVIVTSTALINVVKRHQKPRGATMQGGIIDKDMPLDVSNVAIVCPKDGATRVGYKVTEGGDKARICRKCGQEL